MKTQSAAISVTEISQVGEARRAAAALADTLGFDAQRQGEVGIVVTEAASNLVRHTQGGEIVLRAVLRGAAQGLEILALDRGAGMADVNRCLRDGYSTAGTAGNGLGAILRLSAEFDIHSAPDAGTALWARIWARTPPKEWLDIGAVCLPVQGEQECGDGWDLRLTAGQARIVVADGLGHGPYAADASETALTLAGRNDALELEPLLTMLHQGMRHTRGAAVAVLDVDQDGISYAGVGNICGAVVAPGATQNMVSHHGTIGHHMNRLHAFAYTWTQESLIVLHSDGLTTQWRLDKYPGLMTCHPSLIAGVLYRDFRRERDDVTVLVARRARGDGA